MAGLAAFIQNTESSNHKLREEVLKKKKSPKFRQSLRSLEHVLEMDEPIQENLKKIFSVWRLADDLKNFIKTLKHIAN